MTAGKLPIFGALGAALLLLCGCGSDGPFVSERSLVSEKTVITDARTRLTNVSTPTAASVHGRVVPSKIVCAEPSPDVATTLSQAITASFSAAGEGKGISAQAAGQFGKSLSEGLVQMTERTATLQLLRDSLHRACEAYANGALSDVSYSLLMSRYDELMVTLLTGELTANSLGRQLAAISGEAGHAAGVLKDLVDERQAALVTAKGKADEQQKKLEDAQKAQEDQQKSRDAAVKPDSGKDDETKRKEEEKLAAAKKSTEDEQRKMSEANRAVRAAERAVAEAEAGLQSGYAKTIASPAGKIDGKVTPQLADRLVALHDRFMQPSTRALFISCVTVLDRPESERRADQTHLMEICKDVLQEFRRGLHLTFDARSLTTGDLGLVTLSQTQEHYQKIAQTVSAAAEAMTKLCSEASNKENAKECMEKLPAVIRALGGPEPAKAAPPAGAGGSQGGGDVAPVMPRSETKAAVTPTQSALPRMPVSARPLPPAASVN